MGRRVVVGQTATVGWVASLLEAVVNGENHVLCWVQMLAGYRRTPISSQHGGEIERLDMLHPICQSYRGITGHDLQPKP